MLPRACIISVDRSRRGALMQRKLLPDREAES